MPQSRTTSAPNGPGGMLPPTVLRPTRLPMGRGQTPPPELQRLRRGCLCYRGVGSSKAHSCQRLWDPSFWKEQ